MAVCARLLTAQNDAGSISGRITNGLTAAGIEGAKVKANCLPVAGSSPRCAGYSTQATADNTGTFRIANAPDGSYQVTVEKDGFGAQYQVAKVSAAQDARLDLQLTPLAKLSGRVVDPEGKPVPGIPVQIGAATKVTDQEGAFTFEKLSPSSYKLSAKVKPQADGKDGERLVTTFFPSTAYPEQAVPIKIQGVDVSGFEIRLRTAPARTVRGVVTDATGKPVPHISVVLGKPTVTGLVAVLRGAAGALQLGPETATPWDYVQTGDDGTFEFPAVLEGDWNLRAQTLTSSRQSGAADLRVGRANIENAEIHMVQPFPIEVSPDWSEAAPDAPKPAQVSLVPTGRPRRRQPRSTDADAPFTHHAEGYTGRYLFGPGEVTRGYYVAAATIDGRDVLNQAVTLSGPTTVKVILKKDGGSVKGTVEKGSGATVVLMADPTPAARFGILARCDADGNFSIPDVAPAHYSVAAFQDQQIRFLPSTDLLTRFEAARSERVQR